MQKKAFNDIIINIDSSERGVWMYKIAIDAMGGDNGSKVVVEAIKKFLKDYKDVEFFVCGKEEELSELEGLVTIIDAKDVMGMEDGALQVMRKKESSMIKAVILAKDNQVDAVISAGSTAAFLTAATIHLKLINGVSRAALVSPFPTRTGDNVILLDIGANNENTAQQIFLFAKMGKIFTKAYKNVEVPRMFLLSNGVEESKGSPIIQEAHLLIKQANIKGFEGNIEARDVLNGKADVVVTGGFEGNIFLKGAEGTAKMMGDLLKDAFKKNIFTKIGYLFAKTGVDQMKKKLDYKSYGGALLLGVNNVVVKAHGSSDDYAFYNAIRVAYEMIQKEMINKIRKEFE